MIAGMNRSDQLVEAWYSPEVEALKDAARRSLHRATACGLTAVVIFGVAGFLMFVMMLVTTRPGVIAAFVVCLLATPVLAVLSWVFMFRYLSLSRRAKLTVDEKMRRHLARDRGAAPGFASGA
jgi:hypothetical protein